MSISNKIKIYYNQIKNLEDDFEKNIKNVGSIINDISYNNIYITGIGKSHHITKKTVATWQSIGLKAYSLLVQDLFHGDLGILRDNDIIIYITNSGNTEELLLASEYINKNYNITQISITNNDESKIKKNVNYSINICNFKIEEADSFNIIPSVSSVLFLMFLDLLGMHLSELNEFTKEQFKKNHPSGIGKYI
jgi:arabinose-5-phosphate isomerase